MRATIFLAAAMVAVGCGPQQVATRYVAQADVTAASGGTLTVAGDNPLTGLTLTIPAGAVDSATHITVEIGDALSSGGSIAGTSALFEPSGLVFHSAATMTMPIAATITDTTRLFIQGEEENGTRFKVPHRDVQVIGSTVSFSVLGFTTFQPGLGTVCSADSDCDMGESCQSGTCAAGGVTCAVDSDCASGQACRSGACVATSTCTNDAQCAMGQLCVSGACVVTTACSSDSQCAAGQSCVSGACQPIDTGGPDAGLQCFIDADCASGQICVNSVCTGDLDGGQPDAGLQCVVDSDCGSGQACRNGVCSGGQPDAGDPDAGSSCNTDSDCGSGQTCIALQCVDVQDGGQGPSDGGVLADGGVCPGADIVCNEVCIDSQNDSSNCGACGAVCPTSMRCAAGACH